MKNPVFLTVALFIIFLSSCAGTMPQTAEEFRKAYPDLTDRQIEQFINETEGDLNKLFLELSGHIVTESYPHITELKHLAETLSDRYRHIYDFELHRLFLHKLLLLLDYEIMEGTIS